MTGCPMNIENQPCEEQVYECDSLGAGNEVYTSESIVGDTTTFNFKSLVAGTGVSMTPSSDSITISNTSTSSNMICKTVTYNYLQTTFVNLATIYSGGSPSIDPYAGASLGGSALNFFPRDRQTTPATIPFTLTNGTRTQQGTVTFIPNLPSTFADEPLLCCDTIGRFWRVSVVNSTETLFLNYDGTTLTIPNLTCMALDKEDNILFFTLSTAPNDVRFYNFATKSNVSMITGLGFNIKSMTYANNQLYLMSATDGDPITVVYINPWTRSLPAQYGMVNNIAQPYTSIGSVRDSIAVSPTGFLYFSIDPMIGNSQLVQCYPFGSTTAIATNAFRAIVTNYYLTFTNRGILWIYATDTKRFYSSRVISTVTGGYTSPNDYVDITGYPYIA